MKTRIGDETLAYLIDIFEHRPDEFQNITVVAALNELKQHRTAQHKRRWRKIADEYPKTLRGVEFCNIEIGAIHRLGEEIGSADWVWFGNVATHWRPQDTDLPPADIDSAATISDV